MATKESLGNRWENYRPSKAVWLWSCVASVIVTIVIGFSWGGWVTGGTATRAAEEAAASARAQLAAQVCFNKFASSPDAAAHLAALRDAYVYQRNTIINDQGWATMPGGEQPVAGAADLCADRILEASLPTTSG